MPQLYLSPFFSHKEDARLFVFLFNDTATTEIYSLSLHDALPISVTIFFAGRLSILLRMSFGSVGVPRSEEHTSELQSHSDLVCRLLLETKKTIRRRSRWLLTASTCRSINTSVTRAIARRLRSSSFFFNDTATTEIYTLSLHDALPI